MGWCRWWDETLHDGKLERTARDLGWDYIRVLGAWGGILILANTAPVRGRLTLGSGESLTPFDISKALGITEADADVLLVTLVKHKLLKTSRQCLCVTNWNKRQFESDLSSKRVQEWRQRKRECNIACNNNATPPDNRQQTTDTDSETDVVVEGEEARAKRSNLQLLDQLIPGQVNDTARDWLHMLEDESGQAEIHEVLLLALAARPKSYKPYIQAMLLNRQKERTNGTDSRPRSNTPPQRADRGKQVTRTGPDSRVRIEQYE
jgi:hypothetical protein